MQIAKAKVRRCEGEGAKVRRCNDEARRYESAKLRTRRSNTTIAPSLSQLYTIVFGPSPFNMYVALYHLKTPLAINNDVCKKKNKICNFKKIFLTTSDNLNTLSYNEIEMSLCLTVFKA